MCVIDAGLPADIAHCEAARTLHLVARLRFDKLGVAARTNPNYGLIQFLLKFPASSIAIILAHAHLFAANAEMLTPVFLTNPAEGVTAFDTAEHFVNLLRHLHFHGEIALQTTLEMLQAC